MASSTGVEGRESERGGRQACREEKGTARALCSVIYEGEKRDWGARTPQEIHVPPVNPRLKSGYQAGIIDHPSGSQLSVPAGPLNK